MSLETALLGLFSASPSTKELAATAWAAALAPFLAGVSPTGTIQLYGGAAAPSGWLTCDGSAVSRTTYAALFTAVGTTFGSGDGINTFNIPDLRGRAPIGSGTGSGLTPRTLGATDGTETHTHSTPSGTSGSESSHTHSTPSGTSGSESSHTHAGAAHTHDINHDHGAVTSGGGSAHSHTGPSHSHDDGTLAADSHTLTTTEMPSHSHSAGPTIYWNASDTHQHNTSGGMAEGTSSVMGSSSQQLVIGSTGGGGGHTHTVSGSTGSAGTGATGNESAHTHSVDVAALGVTASGAASATTTGAGSSHTHSTPAGTSGAGSSHTHSTPAGTSGSGSSVQPSLVVHYIIKT